jgi:translation initiation factor SUI1
MDMINIFDDFRANVALNGFIKIHIRIQLRGRKYVTIVENLSNFDLDFDINKIFNFLQQKLHCGGYVADSNIILQGDFRNEVKMFLIQNDIVNKDDIVIHGF